MPKAGFCPISIKTIICNSGCAWFSEDVDACSLWKIAEGFATLTALATHIIEEANKKLEEAISIQRLLEKTEDTTPVI